MKLLTLIRNSRLRRSRLWLEKHLGGLGCSLKQMDAYADYLTDCGPLERRIRKVIIEREWSYDNDDIALVKYVREQISAGFQAAPADGLPARHEDVYDDDEA